MKNRKIVSRGILAVAVLMIAAGIVWTASDYFKRAAAQKEYSQLAEMAREPAASAGETVSETGGSGQAGPYVSPVNFEELKKINPEVVGWIKVEGTKIDYPVVQTDNNDTYLKTDFDGKPSVYGAIYLDCECEPDFSGKHNIIYGHNMKDGGMFKDIVRYKEADFFRAHKDIYIYTPHREIHLRALSALYTDAGGIRRKTEFDGEESFDAYVEDMTKGCAFREMPDFRVERLYSLVTCSYEFDDARTILYAYEVPEDAAP